MDTTSFKFTGVTAVYDTRHNFYDSIIALFFDLSIKNSKNVKILFRFPKEKAAMQKTPQLYYTQKLKTIIKQP